MTEFRFVVSCILVGINLGLAIKNRNNYFSLINWSAVGFIASIAMLEWRLL